jgi:hypothetical protein
MDTPVGHYELSSTILFSSAEFSRRVQLSSLQLDRGSGTVGVGIQNSLTQFSIMRTAPLAPGSSSMNPALATAPSSTVIRYRIVTYVHMLFFQATITEVRSLFVPR